MNPPAPSHPGLHSILALAFGAGDGAYAWKKETLSQVFETLGAAGLAVAGGEVWGIRGIEIFGWLPTRTGHTRIFAWSTPDKAPGTDWGDYVARSIEHARQAVLTLNVESEVVPAFRDRLVYHLQFFDAKDYHRQTQDLHPVGS
jgi:hypothetical protein